jgi:hypothetical protein
MREPQYSKCSYNIYIEIDEILFLAHTNSVLHIDLPSSTPKTKANDDYKIPTQEAKESHQGNP